MASSCASCKLHLIGTLAASTPADLYLLNPTQTMMMTSKRCRMKQSTREPTKLICWRCSKTWTSLWTLPHTSTIEMIPLICMKRSLKEVQTQPISADKCKLQRLSMKVRKIKHRVRTLTLTLKSPLSFGSRQRTKSGEMRRSRLTMTATLWSKWLTSSLRPLITVRKWMFFTTQSRSCTRHQANITSSLNLLIPSHKTKTMSPQA